jgi:hypothetical protein
MDFKLALNRRKHGKIALEGINAVFDTAKRNTERFLK